MKKTFLGFSLLLFSLSINGCIEKKITTNNNYPVVSSTPIHTPAPITTTPTQLPSVVSTQGDSHQLKTVQGPLITIQEKSNGFLFPQYQGKIVLVQLFGKECEYCFEEMPFIKSMQRKYGQNLNIVALQAQDQMSQATAQRLIQRFDMNYPIIDKDEASRLLYFIKNTYGWSGILPFTLLVKDGVTEYSFSGKVDHQEFEDAIRSIL
ncbi:MAG: Unknown protein [uncultured Sulfurovum sp.]|uniref:Thioredoxin domain-containing protein n=1 Tax=uncultured Sulfurovum sp. TaxID=269237 RepID=A0A6S6S0F2_9BACT|nr:MAG: Unknown protein [uncultured Sulfurovum sp.]